MEEVFRDRKDKGQPIYAAFLDIKSAFDVVSHQSLLRKLFHTGIEGQTWSLIQSLQDNSESVVKWQGSYSQPFKVNQGFRQGGILSTDLFKYGKAQLDRMTTSGQGCYIEEVCCVAPTCADDMVVLTDDKVSLQFLLNIAVGNNLMEKYLLQPVKGVLLYILNSIAKRTTTKNEPGVTLKGEPMPVVSETMHMGILRSSDTQETAVQENIAKAQRTLSSLMASGLHGENGLDPETCAHLLQIYVLPVLVYGLEVILPKPALVEKLNKVYKKMLKQILSLPSTVADSAVYILAGALPIEGVFHKRALILFDNVCRLEEDSVEKQLARRQLAVKSFSSCSWYVEIRKILIRYDLPTCWDLLDDPPKKVRWRKIVNKQVNGPWARQLRQSVELYSSLKHLTASEYWPRRKHPHIHSYRTS